MAAATAAELSSPDGRDPGLVWLEPYLTAIGSAKGADRKIHILRRFQRIPGISVSS
jgi:hypothetical protein